jgi:hypothetical protein
MAVSTTSIVVKDALNVSQSLATQTDPGGVETYAMSTDLPGQAFYRASANFTPQATAAVTMITVTGSATKTVRIRRVLIGGVSTANAQSIFALQRTTALGAGGTVVTPTIGKLDSGTIAAATAVVTHYTTTLKAAGTASGGPLATFQVMTNVVTTPTISITPVMAFPELGAPIGQAIVLRGVSDFLEVQNITPTNLSLATVLFYTIEWTEDGS